MAKASMKIRESTHCSAPMLKRYKNAVHRSERARELTVLLNSTKRTYEHRGALWSLARIRKIVKKV